eukprot:12399527-Karenia_brevis.AAC.1
MGSKILMLASKVIIDGVENLDVGVKHHHRWGRKLLMLASDIFLDGLENLDVGVKNHHRWGRTS